ncbi:hypothetical protein G7Y89_g7180 [Cudoniella acicularis]|uniref:DUF6594 domain-containing protein n=1 Tax=Cudoniella acicularis TaxID=354080 RepID=A0A8H4RJU6_9HELO|nr:hypothetical protein G7Y89_g7180 [Cudoniella acicularis]
MVGEARLNVVRDDQEDDDNRPMRSFVGTGIIITQPEPEYDEGEKAFIEYEDPRQGKTNLVVVIASPGQWNPTKQQIEYRLKLRDGTCTRRFGEDYQARGDGVAMSPLSGMSQKMNIDDVMEKGEAASPVTFSVPSPTSTDMTITKLSKPDTELEPVEECPAGYPRLAAFLDSDENFMLYRRFGFLQARALLYKQDELRELEEELDKLDQKDSKTRPKKLKMRQRDDAENEDRRKLIQNITKTFQEYADLLKSARELAGFNRASHRDYRSVTNYFNSTAPLCNKESYIYRKEDIITLKPGRENAWLDAVIEDILQKLSCPLIRKIFSDENLRQKTDPKATNIILYSRERINIVVSLLITLMILALLIVPVYILWKLTRTANFTNTRTAVIIGLLLVFTLVFSVVLSLFTRARRHEVLAAAAGYCAVLVVFIGNIGQLSSTS